MPDVGKCLLSEREPENPIDEHAFCVKIVVRCVLECFMQYIIRTILFSFSGIDVLLNQIWNTMFTVI